MSQKIRGMFCDTTLVIRIEHTQFEAVWMDWVDVASYINDAVNEKMRRNPNGQPYMNGRYVHDISISDYKETDDSSSTT